MATIIATDFLNVYLVKNQCYNSCEDVVVISNAINSIRFQVGDQKVPIVEFTVDSVSADVALNIMLDIKQSCSDFLTDEGSRRIEKASWWAIKTLKSRRGLGEDVSDERRKLEHELDLMRAEIPKVHTVKEVQLLW